MSASPSLNPINLAKVHASYGGQTQSLKVDEASGSSVLQFQILASTELVLRENLNGYFTIPSDGSSQGKGIRVFLERTNELVANLEYANSGIQVRCTEENEVRCEWLEDLKCSIDLAVYFFTVRNLLRNSKYPMFLTPLPLQLAFPLLPSHSRPSFQPSFLANVAHMKGYRPYMEDMDIIHEHIQILKGQSTVSIFGVWDGHGGKDCAVYMTDEVIWNSVSFSYCLIIV